MRPRWHPLANGQSGLSGCHSSSDVHPSRGGRWPVLVSSSSPSVSRISDKNSEMLQMFKICTFKVAYIK